MAGTQSSNRAGSLRNYDVVVAMQVDVESMGPRSAIDVAVAAVQAEKIAVVTGATT
jgi:hypothetical protein